MFFLHDILTKLAIFHFLCQIGDSPPNSNQSKDTRMAQNAAEQELSGRSTYQDCYPHGQAPQHETLWVSIRPYILT